MRIILVNEDIAVKAGEYKLRKIPIADAIISASAWFIGAEVVTSDDDFEKVEEIEVVRFR